MLSVTYRDHREGPGGPPSGATNPRRLRGPRVVRDQPQVGWCAPHKGPRRLGFGEGVLPPNLGGKFPPSPPLAATLRWDWGCQHMSFDLSLAQPYLSPFSSPAVLGEALLDCHAPPSPPRRCAAAGRSLPQPLPLSLLDQGVGDVTGLYVC